MEAHEIAARSQQAQFLKDNPLLKESFESVRSGLVKALEQVSITDRDKQQAITLSLQCLAQIEQYITSCIDDQKVAEFNLAQRKRFKVF